MREAASSLADDGAIRVSVVMPVFNAEATLAQAIDSVLAQTRPVHELIVVDDCSSDGSPAMIEDYARRDPRVKPIRQPANAGVAQARNAGIDAATGTHIAFLDSDDWWALPKIEVQLAELRRTGAKVCYAAYQRVDEAGKPLSNVRPPASVGYRDLLKSNHIGHLTGIYDRSVGDIRFRRIGHEDYAFWLDVVRASGAAAVCATHAGPLAFYTVRQGSVSANKVRAAGWQWRIYRDVAHLDVFAATRYMLHYVFHALAKRRSGVT